MLRFKVLSAVAAVAAGLGMGVVTVAVGANTAQAKVKVGDAGETVIQTTPPTTLNMHGPFIKAIPYRGH